MGLQTLNWATFVVPMVDRSSPTIGAFLSRQIKPWMVIQRFVKLLHMYFGGAGRRWTLSLDLSMILFPRATCCHGGALPSPISVGFSLGPSRVCHLSEQRYASNGSAGTLAVALYGETASTKRFGSINFHQRFLGICLPRP